jgi:hypothetical protein
LPQHSVHGEWAISLAVQIDCYQPGFCGELLRVSAERRQVLAAYLTSKPPSEGEMADVGHFLRTADHRAILAAAFDAVPTGFRRALRRSGEHIHERRFYQRLHQLLTKPPHRKICRCIARLSKLDLTALDIVASLPHTICEANVVTAIESAADVADIVAGFRLLTSRGVDETALASAITEVRTEREFRSLWRTWVLKAKAPEHPIPLCEWYRPITTADELRKLAIRYRNCARRYLTDLLDEGAGHAFAEVKSDGRGAVVHLEKEGHEWRLEGIYGPRNSRAPQSLQTRTHDYLQAHGVRIGRDRYRQSEWDSLRRLLGGPFFEFDFN